MSTHTMTGTAKSSVLSAPPDKPDPAARHVFYLHGRIIEEAGRRPTHPRWGVYEYDAVLEALQKRGYVVISEQRKSGTAPRLYALKIAGQVRQLLAAGVPPNRITVVGFSKGGGIAQIVSAELKPKIRYVFIASCNKDGSGPHLNGHALSLRERSDTLVGSCGQLFAASSGLAEQREIQIEIGGEHGAFYRPHEAWMAPLREWIER